MLVVTPQIRDLTFRAIAESETGKSTKKWFSLYLAKIGKSGLSFGPIQYDIRHNTTGRKVLADCGVSHSTIEKLVEVHTGMSDEELSKYDDLVMEANTIMAKVESQDIIVGAAKNYIDQTLNRIAGLRDVNVKISRKMAIFLSDYHIQFHIDKDGQIHNWLKQQEEPLTVEKFMQYKNSMRWVQTPEGKRDSDRRYNVLRNFCKENGIWAEEIDESPEHKEVEKLKGKSLIPEWLRIWE